MLAGPLIIIPHPISGTFPASIQRWANDGRTGKSEHAAQTVCAVDRSFVASARRGARVSRCAGRLQSSRHLLRVAWGGGAERQWHGSIAIDQGSLRMVRPLGIVADAPGSIWSDSDRLMEIRQRSARAYDGVDVEVFGAPDAKLTVTLTPDGNGRAVASEMKLAEVAAKIHRQALDDHENQLLVRRSPGDVLRISTLRDPLIFCREKRGGSMCSPGRYRWRPARRST